jgi:hypothetical protein
MMYLLVRVCGVIYRGEQGKFQPQILGFARVQLSHHGLPCTCATNSAVLPIIQLLSSTISFFFLGECNRLMAG